MLRVTGGDYVVAGATLLASWIFPLSKGARERRSAKRAQRAYERGVKGVPGVVDAVPTGAERTAALEREMKQQRGLIRDIQTDVTTLLEGHEDIKHRLDKLSTGNGGDTYELPDVIQRVAKALDVWDPPDTPKNRRKGDPRAAQ